MSGWVSTKNVQEEKVLSAFLNSLRYNHQPDAGNTANELNRNLIDQ